MNSPVRSLDKPKNYGTWLRFRLKSNWQQFVFYAIVMLLACVVTSIIGIESNLETIRMGYSYNLTPADRGGELFKNITLVFTVVSGIIGIFAGMSSTGYVNSRKAVHCWHSLPLTRDALYMADAAVQGFYYLVSALGSMLIGTVLIAVRLGITAEMLGEGMMQIFVGIGTYLLVFSLFQLAGALTGTAVFRFIMAGLIAFLPVLVYLLVFWGVDQGMNYIQVEKYTNWNFIRFLCPAVNVYFAMAAAFAEMENILGGEYTRFVDFLQGGTLYLTAAVYWVLGLWLHRKRRSELSEASVLWKKLQAAAKYPVVFVCGAGGAIFFRALFGGGVSWMIFGGICGMVLSFLLMNVLITRNTRSMFKGLPGFGITAVAVAVFLAVIPFDIFGVNHFMYPPEQVKSLTIRFSNMTLELDDPEEIGAVMPYITAAVEEHGDGNVPYDQVWGEDTAFWIDPEQVIGTAGTDYRDELSRVYSDRKVYLEDGKNPIYVWMSGKRFDIGYYDDLYMRETVMVDGKTTVQATVDKQYGGDYSYDSYRVEVSVYPKFGLPLHRYVRIGEVSDNVQIYDTLQNLPEYSEQYAEIADTPMEELVYFNVNLMHEHVDLLAVSAMRELLHRPEYSEVLNRYNAMLNTLQAAASVYTPEMAETPVLGQLTFGTYEYDKVYPLYAGMTQFWDAWAAFWEEMPDFIREQKLDVSSHFPKSFQEYYDMLRYTNYQLYRDGEDIMDWVSTFHRYTWIIEADTGRALYIDDSRRTEVLENALLKAHGTTAGLADRRYLIVSSWFGTDDMKAGLASLMEENLYVNARNCVCFFRDGAVPRFVLDAFGN